MQTGRRRFDKGDLDGYEEGAGGFGGGAGIERSEGAGGMRVRMRRMCPMRVTQIGESTDIRGSDEITIVDVGGRVPSECE